MGDLPQYSGPNSKIRQRTISTHEAVGIDCALSSDLLQLCEVRRLRESKKST